MCVRVCVLHDVSSLLEGGHGSPVPSAPAPGGHERLSPPSGVSGELEREMKEGSFAGPVLGVPSSFGVDSDSRLT